MDRLGLCRVRIPSELCFPQHREQTLRLHEMYRCGLSVLNIGEERDRLPLRYTLPGICKYPPRTR